MGSSTKWTDEQLQAIKTKGNNILVAAAAGSGKTAVLVERIINKIINEKINIDELLIVTFTNAAASEMRERILEAIYKKIEETPEDTHLQKQINLINKASICTIDSFCLDVVKNNFYEIDATPNFRIADSAELELIKQEALEELFEKKYETNNNDFINLLETYTTYSGDEPLKELILEIYRFTESHPYPLKWLEVQTEKYNLSNKLEEDFSKNDWGQIILKDLKENILDAKMKLQIIKKDLQKFDELIKFTLVLGEDINTLDTILKLENWDDIYKYTSEIVFTRWPVDKKITLEEKDIAKDKRDAIKKQINENLSSIDCTSKQANEDIFYMYKSLKSLKDLIIEYDELLKQKKKEKNIVNFSDIEHMALNILVDNENKPTEIANKYKKKFKEIAIDEYQDSNLIQESILTSISTGNNIFMVGDVKQSIYKFRQARPELFLEKYEKYNNINNVCDDNGIKIQLFKNFRSRENVLDTTNIIFKNIMSKELGNIEYSEEEYLNLGANFEECKEKAIYKNTEVFILENKNIEIEDDNLEIEEEKLENIELEAKFVSKKINELINSKELVFDKHFGGYRPITYKDIVILLRSTKEKANIFENELINLNIPVYSDTSLEYLNSIEIQTIMNLLKVIDNPTIDIPLVSVLRSMIGGFNDNELIEIRLENNRVSFYESMIKYKENNENNISNKINRFLDKIKKWKEETEYLELDEFIWKLYVDTGYYNYVSTMPDGLLRTANLKLLFEKAKQYEKANFIGLYNFINFIEKVKNNSGDLSSAKLIGENENVVRIMSIHKSKGLEFPVVFLCNTNKKFNMQDLNSPILTHQDLGFGLKYINADTKIQYSTFARESIKIKSREEVTSEEMRILYVALTRAKERLIITGVSKNAKKDLDDKKEQIKICSQDEKININLLKKYKSYLDWIELVYLKNSKTDIMTFDIIEKNEIVNDDIIVNSEDNQEQKLEQILKETTTTKMELIKDKINWEYDYIELSKIEGKTSVSKLKENKEETEKIIKVPNFIKETTTKLTGAQKGTLIHLCMQNLNTKIKYDINTVNELIENLQSKSRITEIEAQNIDKNKILQFTKSKLWEEMQSAKIIEREKPFYITLTANEIYNNGLEDEILVQGIIDLYYVNENDEIILVDYKTDYVQEEGELVEKYKKQLELYKRALEASMNKKVKKVYIYSTHLSKEIEIV